jgi:hypothetical protein
MIAPVVLIRNRAAPAPQPAGQESVLKDALEKEGLTLFSTKSTSRKRTMQKTFAAVLFAAGLIAAQLAWAEDKIADVTDMNALRAVVRADKKAFVASTLKLTDLEAKRFWPLYENYQRVLNTTNRRLALAVEAVVSLDKPVSDLYARNLANELIAADEEEIKARRALHNRLMRGVPNRVLPPRKAARYLQLESKIRAMQDYDIATGIPLVK